MWFWQWQINFFNPMSYKNVTFFLILDYIIPINVTIIQFKKKLWLKLFNTWLTWLKVWSRNCQIYFVFFENTYFLCQWFFSWVRHSWKNSISFCFFMLPIHGCVIFQARTQWGQTNFLFSGRFLQRCFLWQQEEQFSWLSGTRMWLLLLDDPLPVSC